MAPRSTIELDKTVKAVADAAIRDGCTIDEIVERLEQHGVPASRSSVGRYAKKARATMERVREAQAVAKVWVDEFGKDPEGDIGQLLPQMLHAVAFTQVNSMAEQSPDLTGEDGVSPKHVSLLASAIKDLASAQKINADRILKIRKETAEKAVAEVDKVAKQRGLSPEAVAEIRSKILGVAA